MLSGPIASTRSESILRLPPSIDDQNCSEHNETRFRYGCDRHPSQGEAYKKLEARMPKLTYRKPLLSKHLSGIYTRMHALLAFTKATHNATMSRSTARMLEFIHSEHGRFAKVVHCHLGPLEARGASAAVEPSSKQECYRLLLSDARKVRTSGARYTTRKAG